MKATDNNTHTYRDLDALRQRKKELRLRLNEHTGEMQSQAKSLFAGSKSTSPSKKISALISNSGTTIDMALLSWKLYQRFGGKKKAKKQKKQKKGKRLLGFFRR